MKQAGPFNVHSTRSKKQLLVLLFRHCSALARVAENYNLRISENTINFPSKPCSKWLSRSQLTNIVLVSLGSGFNLVEFADVRKTASTLFGTLFCWNLWLFRISRHLLGNFGSTRFLHSQLKQLWGIGIE